MKSPADCRLYTFVDTAYLHGRKPEFVAQQLCEGGSDLIQLRAKNSPPDEVLEMAEKIRTVTQPAGVGLVINDHLQVAVEADADMCHLGQEDFFDAGHTNISQLRTTANNRNFPVKIGISTHSPEQAARAIAARPAYIAIGPVYTTGTKPFARPVTLEFVRWASANVSIPWFAIGGITLANLDQVIAAGARRICVVSAILNAPDIAKACREFQKRLV